MLVVCLRLCSYYDIFGANAGQTVPSWAMVLDVARVVFLFCSSGDGQSVSNFTLLYFLSSLNYIFIPKGFFIPLLAAECLTFFSS